MWIIKKKIISVLEPFMHICNLSFSKGIFPLQMKIAKVIPIFKSGDKSQDRISELLHSMQSCISDVKAWATANMLKLNDRKTELMLVTSKRSMHLHNLPTSITIGNAQIPFKQSVKNLGFTLDCHLTMNAHVSNIARTCYFELRRLASIRRFLTNTATATLVSAFVLSRIDYCNSLLFGSTHDVTSHLQRIQNYAARVILRLPVSSSITIHLKSLHWLPVKV